MFASSKAPVQISEKQATKIRANWKRISRLGTPLFILGMGTVLLLWMCICFVSFTYLYGTQKVLREPIILESTLPCMAFLSYLFPVFYYLMVKGWIRRIGPGPAEALKQEVH